MCEHNDDVSSNTNTNGLSNGAEELRNARQRSTYDTLNPRANYKDICGRRFIRQSRIVGGGVSNYGEWPWQVSIKFSSGCTQFSYINDSTPHVDVRDVYST